MVNMKRKFLGETYTRNIKEGHGYKTKAHAKKAAMPARNTNVWVRVVKTLYKGKPEYHLYKR